LTFIGTRSVAAPPSALPGISPTRGEIGRRRARRSISIDPNLLLQSCMTGNYFCSG
jgi:hypothetical protein